MDLSTNEEVIAVFLAMFVGINATYPRVDISQVPQEVICSASFIGFCGGLPQSDIVWGAPQRVEWCFSHVWTNRNGPKGRKKEWFLKWGYPNGWMVCNGKSQSNKWMTEGTPMTQETSKCHFPKPLLGRYITWMGLKCVIFSWQSNMARWKNLQL